MQVAIYRFYDSKWVETKQLTEKDVALLIDAEKKTIYIWEGRLSSSRNQTLAKGMLGNKKVQYPNFKFRLASTSLSEEFEALLKDALKDTEDIKLRIARNEAVLEKFVRGLSLVVALFYCVVLGRLLGHSAGLNFEASQEYIAFFPSLAAFSGFMQINIFMILIISILSVLFVIISVLLRQPNRFAFATMSIIGLFLIVFQYWEDAIKKIFEMGEYNGFRFLESYFYGFIINSALLIGICFCFFLISVYYPKDPTTKS